MKKNLITVVLSGGAGTRLWPASREGYPKPFMKLPDGQTLIEKTYLRVKALGSEVLTVTNRDYYFMSLDEMERAGVSGSFLLEPFGRNTAPAIALAAKMIEAMHGADTMMLILAADHLIGEQASFISAVEEAKKLAGQDYLVTFGILPTSPETGFGYIECGESLGSGNKVARFVEKPDLKAAKDYLASGKYLWNSGMFCFKASVFINELIKHAPEIALATDACWTALNSLENPRMLEIPASFFKDIPDVSIDYALMEKSDRVAVVPGRFDWNDVGSWNAIRDLIEPDSCQNRVLGEAILMDSHNTFVQSKDRLVVAIGINELIIVDTADALLVAHSNKAQNVKQVVAQLKKNQHDAFKLHRTVVRPWGTYTILEQGSGFKIKRIEVKPGASLSLQKHKHRSEHWVVVSGGAKITNGDNETLIQANESTFIPAGQKHRLENPGAIPCVMIEVQCGLYLGEDDIVRFDDVYGRTNK